MHQGIVKMMMAYCLPSATDSTILNSPPSSTQDQNEIDAWNSFIISFLETDEDQFNTVSIRLSVTESLEQMGFHDMYTAR